MAEGEGFEPPEPVGSTVFETAPFNRSGTPPAYTHKVTFRASALQLQSANPLPGVVKRVLWD